VSIRVDDGRRELSRGTEGSSMRDNESRDIIQCANVKLFQLTGCYREEAILLEISTFRSRNLVISTSDYATFIVSFRGGFGTIDRLPISENSPSTSGRGLFQCCHRLAPLSLSFPFLHSSRCRVLATARRENSRR